MKRIEKILVVLVVLGVVMKLLSIEGGSFTMFIGLWGLICFYLIFTFFLLNNISFRRIFTKEPYVNISTARMIGAVGCGVIFSSVCIGLLFMAFRYPGWEVQVIVPLIPLLIVLVISAIKYKSSSNRLFYVEVLIRGIVMVVSGLFVFGLL
jgi:hypothetical protein